MEIWKQIPGYDGWYDASTLGNIRSWVQKSRWANRLTTPNVLKPYPKSKTVSYLVVRLSNRKDRVVHQLIMQTFIGPCPDGLEVCHNNGNETDNRLENLRYDTHLNNLADKIRHGTASSKLSIAQVKEIRSRYIRGQKPTMFELSKEYKIDCSVISNIINNKAWTHI